MRQHLGQVWAQTVCDSSGNLLGGDIRLVVIIGRRKMGIWGTCIYTATHTRLFLAEQSQKPWAAPPGREPRAAALVRLGCSGPFSVILIYGRIDEAFLLLLFGFDLFFPRTETGLSTLFPWRWTGKVGKTVEFAQSFIILDRDTFGCCIWR